MNNSIETVISHLQKYSGRPDIVIKSPGRINIIGEHTDYNEGLALTFAADKSIYFAGRINKSDVINLFALDINGHKKIHVHRDNSSSDFDRYIISALHVLRSEKLIAGGLDLVFGGDLPIGAGLSSSSSLTCGFIYLLNKIFSFGLNNNEIIRFASMAENSTGLVGGTMDQKTIMMAQKKRAMLLDFYYDSESFVPLDLEGSRFVLFNSNTKHELINSDYNVRRNECEKELSILVEQIGEEKSFRQVDYQMIDFAKEKTGKKFPRLSYVLEENDRVLNAVDFLRNKEYERIGDLLLESHYGLRDKYQVSCEELDWIVAYSERQDFILGCRIMGGGFGGCAIALVEDPFDRDSFDLMAKAYFDKFQKSLNVIPVRSSESITQV